MWNFIVDYILVLKATLSWLLYWPITAAPPKKRISDLMEAMRILTVHSCPESLRSRSTPNKRLRDTFNIENAFTTTDCDVYKEFVKTVKELLNIKSYSDMQGVISEVFNRQKVIFVREFGSKIPLKRFLMVGVFQISMEWFLKKDINRDMSVEELSELSLTIAEEINDLWLKSKKGAVHEDSKRRLFATLKRMFPSVEVENERENPLRLIIPSFETLWRILFRLIVHLKGDESNENELLRLSIELLRRFGENPTKHTFREIVNGISVENIIKEMLFLHPPTRSIYRRLKDGTEVGIDVAEIHRISTIGKQFESQFSYDPRRWSGNKERPPFLSFGYSKFECPAKSIFAPVVIGLAGSVLLDIFQDYSVQGIVRSKIDLKQNDREQYEQIYLQKM